MNSSPQVSSNELRKSFLELFKARDHKAVPSSPLLPKDDPTLLFPSVRFGPCLTEKRLLYAF